MEELQKSILDQMRPDTLVDKDAPWQQRKSGETRVRILDATVDCLVEKGYSGLSTNEITVRTGVSRGAMHHHFPTRMTLVAATIEYTLYQRMERFLKDYAEALDKKSRKKDVAVVGTEVYWRSVQTREYAAYLELAIAARTDAELNSHFLPAARKFDKVWRRQMVSAFPEWEGQWDKLQIANDFVMAAHLGLLLHRPIFGDGKRTRDIRELVVRIVGELHATLA